MSKDLAEEWLQWMKEVHIPEVIATGCFSEYKILRLLHQDADDEGVNYAIQYTCDSLSTLERYRRDFGPALMQKTALKYGENILAYRSVLEVIE
jgi:hypothetical protein